MATAIAMEGRRFGALVVQQRGFHLGVSAAAWCNAVIRESCSSGEYVAMAQRILICGSRTWVESVPIYRHIYGLEPGDVVIHGGARGADSIAGDAAQRSGLTVEVYRADWTAHGKAAGPIRNQRMLTEGKPDRVLAFRMPGMSRGTDDMIRRARAEGVPVEIVEPGPAPMRPKPPTPRRAWWRR
jgi:hypothetical protein